MPQFLFEPPLTLAGDTVVRTLDEAAAFARSLAMPRMPKTKENILRWLERANGEDQQHKAADMFRFWVASEGVLVQDR
jgi:hypothetical protein